jgi:hypothetical protein
MILVGQGMHVCNEYEYIRYSCLRLFKGVAGAYTGKQKRKCKEVRRSVARVNRVEEVKKMNKRSTVE